MIGQKRTTPSRAAWWRSRTAALTMGAVLMCVGPGVARVAGATAQGTAVVAAGVANAVAVENSLPGTVGWDQSPTAPASYIDGYTSEVSVTPGQQVQLHITGAAGVRYRIEIYRLGWYQGIGARLQQCVPSCTSDEAVVARPPMVAPDPVTGFLDAGWPVTDVVTLPGGSVSGLYLAKVVVTSGATVGEARPITFVVREALPASTILVQIGVNTDEAYNNWGGKSLYTFNSSGGVAAVEVSFDRPDSAMNWEMQWDYPLIRFLESRGYDVSYATDVDTAQGIDAPSARRLVVVPGHSEYWSKEIRDALDSAQASGTDMAFMGANTGYWQMRYANNYRAILEYRSASADPDPTLATKTTLFRSLSPPRPECLLEGVQDLVGLHDGYAPPPSNRDFQVVAAALGNPWFGGSGWTASSVLTGLVGYEWDTANQPGCPPTQVLFTWTGLNVYGQSSEADAATFTAPSGARVFAAGSFQYSWGLDGYGHATTLVDPRLQSFTQNMLDDLSGGEPPGNISPPSISGSMTPGQTLVASSASWAGRPAPALSYQWLRCDASGARCTAISGAISPTYTVSFADIGSTLEVVVTATNRLGSCAATSAGGAVGLAAPLITSPTGSAPLGPVTRAAGGGYGLGTASVSRAALSGVANGRATLSFTLTAENGAAALHAVTISLPRGLGFSGSKKSLARGIVVTAGGRRLRFTTNGSRGRLTITLTTPRARVRFTLATPAISPSRTLAKNAEAGKGKTLRIGLTATDTGGTSTPITLRLGAR